jgi:hypothetical protein
MDPQLATQEPICDLSNKNPGSSVSLGGFGSTHDGVLDEELFLEIVANLVRGHDEGMDVDGTRETRVEQQQARMQYGNCRIELAGKIPAASRPRGVIRTFVG